MNTVNALAGVVIKELYRRKDFYVLFVLTALITLAAGSANFFNDTRIVRYLKDICLMLIWVSALLIAIMTTARQLPAERENRTIFPLLAKPVTRGQLVVGKFLGCWLACGLALVVFYVFFAVVTGSREQDWAWMSFFKALWLQWDMLAVVIALVLLGSVLFSAPAPNATICLIVVVGLLFIGPHLNKVALQQPEPLRSLVYAIYFAIPHLEWFDIRNQLVNELSAPGWLDCALASLYAGAYTGLLLFLTWLAFRRQSLNP